MLGLGILIPPAALRCRLVKLGDHGTRQPQRNSLQLIHVAELGSARVFYEREIKVTNLIQRVNHRTALGAVTKAG
jgi:hypothetical protein